MILVIDGKPAVKGMKINTHRDGEAGTLIGWREPHKPSSTGRVHIQLEGKTYQSEFFPSVIGGKFIKEEPVAPPKNTYIRFENGQEDKISKEYGPFEFVQLTYSELRVSPAGDSFAYLYESARWMIEGDETFTDYSDVVIYSK